MTPQVYVDQNFTIFKTQKEWGLILENHMYGPFPLDREFIRIFAKFIEDPDNQKYITFLRFMDSQYKRNRFANPTA